MVQFIDFFITGHNSYSTEMVRFALNKLFENTTVKKWSEKVDGDSTHFSVNGSWLAYSTIAAMIPKKKTPENSIISISIEHFEDDN